jgi:DNA polymerase-3 subunit delta'
MPEPDRLPGAPHPREQVHLFGHLNAEVELLDAYRSARFNHAWLLAGPPGIGKATLAYRLARFVLANPDPAAPTVQAANDLSVPADHRAARQVAAGAHPNLLVLRRQVDPDSGKLTTEISVKFARRALDLFTTTAAESGWRIAIVDSSDDLNANSANALLKLVEEPPPRSLFLIVSHALGRVLPTIRSRCRTLRLHPLASDQLHQAVESLGAPTQDFESIAELAEGSVRRALELIEDDDAELTAAIGRFLSPQGEGARLDALVAFAEKLAGVRNEKAFDSFADALFRTLTDMLRTRSHLPASQLAPIAELWNKLAASRRDVEIFTLDKRPFVISAVQDLTALARRG